MGEVEIIAKLQDYGYSFNTIIHSPGRKTTIELIKERFFELTNKLDDISMEMDEVRDNWIERLK